MSDNSNAVSIDLVKKIAHLARLELRDDECQKFSGQLSNILGSMKILEELDTSNVEPTTQVTGLSSVYDEDVIIDFVEDKARLLKQTKGEVVDNQIVVPSVF